MVFTFNNLLYSDLCLIFDAKYDWLIFLTWDNIILYKRQITLMMKCKPFCSKIYSSSTSDQSERRILLLLIGRFSATLTLPNAFATHYERQKKHSVDICVIRHKQRSPFWFVILVDSASCNVYALRTIALRFHERMLEVQTDVINGIFWRLIIW